MNRLKLLQNPAKGRIASGALRLVEHRIIGLGKLGSEAARVAVTAPSAHTFR